MKLSPNAGIALLVLGACAPAGEELKSQGETASMSVASNTEDRLAKLAPTELDADISVLPASEKEALGHILAAARLMDEIFLRQVWTGNPGLRERVTELGDAAQMYYDANFGPWDRLDEMAPFIGDTPHPAGAGYYPTDMSKEEFEAWLEANPDDREAFEGLHTVIRREGGQLVAKPYSEVYLEWLAPAADHLRQAAAVTENESLRTFLEKRAAAFSSDDYYESDFAWMDLDAPMEVTIGPYEVYEDGLFGYKAAFEAFVTVTLPEESAALERFKIDAALAGDQSAHPRRAQESESGHGKSDPRRRRDLRRWRLQGGCADSGVQPAERRTRARSQRAPRRSCCATCCAPSTTSYWYRSPSACWYRRTSSE